jgi:hypothetical protein
MFLKMPVPGKFDDVSKTASSVLGDDYTCSGHQFKTKNKTDIIGGGSVELAVDLLALDKAPKGDVLTPAKLTFKFPTPFVFLKGFAIDKLEMDKAGKAKLECSLGKALHKIDGLKIDVKSDFACKDPAKQSLSYAAAYTGLKDAVVKVDAKQSALADTSVECLYGGIGGAVIAAKITGISSLVPDVGVNYKFGKFFASCLAKNTFSEFTIHKHYQVSSDLQVAGTYQHGGKKSGTWCVGGTAALGSGVTGKAKFDGSALSLGFKKSFGKTTVLAGGSFNVANSNMTIGTRISAE